MSVKCLAIDALLMLCSLLEVLEDLLECLCGPCEEDTTNRPFTLFSKFPNPHPDAASYPGITHVGQLLSGADPNAASTHPTLLDANGDPQNINGWNVFQVCATSLPATDSNGHDWEEGVPSSFAGTLTYDASGAAADVVCP